VEEGCSEFIIWRVNLRVLGAAHLSSLTREIVVCVCAIVRMGF
jgi:hypothetical protein